MDPDVTLEEREVTLADIKLIKGIWPYVKPYFWMLCISTALVFIVTFLDLLAPIFTQKAFDGFIVPVNAEPGTQILGIPISSFSSFCVLFLCLISGSLVIDFFQTMFMEYSGQKIILHLRCTLFSHMTNLTVAYFDKNSSGRLVARVAGDIENMNEMFTNILVFIFKDLVFMAAILGIMFYINFRLTACIFLLVPFITAGIYIFSKIMRKTFRTIRQKIAEINHSFSETITGIKIIQTTASEHIFLKRFSKLNFEYFKTTLFQIKTFSVFMPFIGFLAVLSTAIILYAGSRGMIRDQLTLGELVAFLSYMKLFFRPLRDLSEKFNLLQNALASAERIITVLDTDTVRQRQTGDRTYLDRIQNIQFENVSFSYDQKTIVLKDIKFSAEQGKSVGIVGRTGSGKSSVINLLTGFYAPKKGRILVNGKNHNSINIKDIRSKTALVMQDPVLFSGTIKENIAPSNQTLEDQALEKALMEANCDFLFEKHAGIGTQIEEGGRPLSSGEKQLVCIARAFAFNPDLIIFDEATSYMDSQSEQKVHEAMKRLMEGRISIIIAHRLSTVRECDTILLLRDGIIREQGTHDQLKKAKGEYYHLLKKEKI
ncbi:MAG: ABC transporter ATP-binding protein [Desulfobacteraceae bacterium]|nr:ABC transporter ATP-binding protein [Desulfobacteraceae bacterium]